MCVECGTPPKLGVAFCHHCKAPTPKEAVVCVKCGVGLTNHPPAESKDWLTALLLCFFLGYLGVHRFYSGSTGIGVAQLLTLGGCGVWTMIDFILILAGSYKDGQGNKLIRR